MIIARQVLLYHSRSRIRPTVSNKDIMASIPPKTSRKFWLSKEFDLIKTLTPLVPYCTIS